MFVPKCANQKEFFWEGFKGDKTFLLIILLTKWVYQLYKYKKIEKPNNRALLLGKLIILLDRTRKCNPNSFVSSDVH
jgi:hypothetical protein